MRPHVEKWSEGVRDLAKFSKRHPQTAYAGLGMSLHLEWRYLQRNVPRVGALMEPIESDLRKEFFPPSLEGWRSMMICKIFWDT